MLIGFTGKKRHGKDTAGLALQRLGFSQLALAEPMRDIVADLYSRLGISDERIEEYLFGDKKQVIVPEIGVTTRHVMQTLGTEWGRNCVNVNLWIQMLVTVANENRDQDFYVTDIRFHNEGECVTKGGGCVIRIFNPRILDDEFSSHPSEQEIMSMKVYAEIINDAGIEELHGKVRNIINSFIELRGSI